MKWDNDFAAFAHGCGQAYDAPPISCATTGISPRT